MSGNILIPDANGKFSSFADANGSQQAKVDTHQSVQVALYDGSGNALLIVKPADGTNNSGSFIQVASMRLKGTNEGDTAAPGSVRGVWVEGAIASGAADSGNPVKSGAVYNSAAPTFSNGNRADNQSDVNGNLKETLATLMWGENPTLNRMMAIHDWNITWITTQTTTTIKSGAGIFGGLLIPTPVASATVKGYDSLAGSGTVAMDTMTFTASPPVQPVTYPADQAFATGLTLVTAGATMSVGVLWL